MPKTVGGVLNSACLYVFEKVIEVIVYTFNPLLLTHWHVQKFSQKNALTYPSSQQKQKMFSMEYNDHAILPLLQEICKQGV